MGAKTSKNERRNEITLGYIENELNKQRQLYEIQTKELLATQRELLTKTREEEKKESFFQATTSGAYNVTAPSNSALYPNLPAVPTGNPHESSLYLNGRMHFAHQHSVTILPSAPPSTSFETQTSEFVPNNFPFVPINLSSVTPPVSGKGSTIKNKRTLSLFKQECPNKLDGCSLRFNESEMIEHLLECPFNDLSCPVNIINRCAWKGKKTQLVNHFDENHPECRQTKVNKEDTLHIGQNYQFINLLDLGSYNFLLHIIIQPHTNKIIFGIQLVGTKISASKWTYQLRLYNKNDPRRLFEYTDSCQSNSVPLHKLLIEDKVATICFDYAQTLSHKKIIAYKIMLKKTDFRNSNNKWKPKQQHSHSPTKVYTRRTSNLMK